MKMKNAFAGKKNHSKNNNSIRDAAHERTNAFAKETAKKIHRK